MSTAQTKIAQIQATYKEWLTLQERLDQAQKDWQQSVKLMNELSDFYFDGEWQDIFEQIENGLEVNLSTDGEYSVMAEDTLWNAFQEQQARLWQLLRFSVKHLDKDAPDFYSKANDE